MSKDSSKNIVIGVLALQGAFSEHINQLLKLNIQAIQVKTEKDLSLCDGLILPGGESTAIGLSINRNNLLDALQKFVKEKPCYGTCAGLILLAESAKNQKLGGQEFIGGLHISIERNAFGHQVDSFTQLLKVKGMDKEFMGVFIRAPVISEIKEGVEILCRVEKGIVGVRQGHLLATCFHPELTNDTRFHQLFVQMVTENKENKT
jgi:5'-phosphate synthase pdxT subunit